MTTVFRAQDNRSRILPSRWFSQIFLSLISVLAVSASTAFVKPCSKSKPHFRLRPHYDQYCSRGDDLAPKPEASREVSRRTILKNGTIGWPFLYSFGVISGSIAILPQIGRADETKPSVPFRVELTVQLDPQTTDIIVIEVDPSLAPLAASRFRNLVEIGFYDDARFFRVLPGYIAQFGISSDPSLNKEWLLCEKRCRALPDEPRLQKNKRGTLSFASSGKNSRQTQIFINLGNNDGPPNFLDAQGFVPFATVVQGMEDVVPKLNSEYGIVEQISGGLAGSVDQTKAAYYGKAYLDTLYPKLSFIKSARIL